MSYREVETLRDPDGVVIIITQRIDTGYHSFKIQKEFEHNGEVRLTSFLGRRHCDAVERLTKEAGHRIDILDEQFKMSRRCSGRSVP